LSHQRTCKRARSETLGAQHAHARNNVCAGLENNTTQDTGKRSPSPKRGPVGPRPGIFARDSYHELRFFRTGCRALCLL